MAIQNLKSKRVQVPAATVPRKPSVARAEVVDKATRARFEAELDAALKRKPASDVKLAGALRAIAPLSPALRGLLVDAAEVMVRRGSHSRELYGACLRTLADCGDRHVASILRRALTTDDAGSNATLSAACFCHDASLSVPLAKVASSRQSHLAFGAETARVCRGESNGAHLASIAPMIKESHRISLCGDLFVPLARSAPIPLAIAPALEVLRGAERHLGRWLVLAGVATKAGDLGPTQEAQAKSLEGPASARSAWSLVAWALAQTRAGGASSVAAPAARPTVELVARLSDRPSADRDTTFLFRLARARAATCKPMLEGLLKGSLELSDGLAVRAATFLVRDHGRTDLKAALIECATNGKLEQLRGFAVAALWDTGDADARATAREMSDALVESPCLSSLAWGALVRAAHAGAIGKGDANFLVVGEAPFRWIECGWLE
jgi:hypothetical protein